MNDDHDSRMTTPGSTWTDAEQRAKADAPLAPLEERNVGLQPGDRVGSFVIRELIGEGGFGVVYQAEQTEPVRRMVALKVIKPGMDSKAVIARFEAERQAIALMNHPCVSKLLDGGLTDAGLPYFVMELVKGLPVTEHCDKHRLGVPQRLELFIHICGAVQHAHTKGVIHRDLKPSNILVEYESGHVTPKIIDFGVAKALNQRLTDRTIFTERGQLVGTPEYMSPEQAEMNIQNIDTRSDVYALGVILYELLTGSRPFETETLRKAGLAEIQRVIREVDPPKPSTKLIALASTDKGSSIATSIAASRQADLRLLTEMLRRDLDWVVMSCLEKDRERRYDTADALAMEIRRFLNNEPVLAGPPGFGYRAAKFIRRHRVGAIAVTAIAVALVLATGISMGFAIVAVRQRSRAEMLLAERDEALAAERQRTDELDQVATFQADLLGTVNADAMGRALRGGLRERLRALSARRLLPPNDIDTLLAEYDAMVDGADMTGLALETLATQMLAPALEAIDREFDQQPLVRARLLQTVATTARDLGLLELATHPQEEALKIRRHMLGDEHPDTLLSISDMGGLLKSRGKFAEAEPFYVEALGTLRRLVGDEHPDTLTSIHNLGSLLLAQGKPSDAEPLLREALETSRRVLGDEHPDTLTTIRNMGGLLESQGKLAKAEPLHRESLETSRRVLGDEHPETLTSINNMAALLLRQGQLAEAEPLFRETLKYRRRAFGDEHPLTLTAIGNMGSLLKLQRKLAEAESLLHEVQETSRRVLGGEHPLTLTSINNMGDLFQLQGKLAQAEPLYREALATKRRVLGDEHPDTLLSISNMGFLLKSQGKLADAEPFSREAMETSRRVLGDEHPLTLTAISNMGCLFHSQGKLAKAEPLYREALETSRRVLGNEHPDTLTWINNMGALFKSQGKFAEAESLFLEALETSRRVLGNEHPDTRRLIRNMNSLRKSQRKHTAAGLP